MTGAGSPSDVDASLASPAAANAIGTKARRPRYRFRVRPVGVVLNLRFTGNFSSRLDRPLGNRFIGFANYWIGTEKVELETLGLPATAALRVLIGRGCCEASVAIASTRDCSNEIRGSCRVCGFRPGYTYLLGGTGLDVAGRCSRPGC